MPVDVEGLKEHLPQYLSEESQRNLLKDLRAFDEGRDISYFLSDYDNLYKGQMLQGDGWSGFEIYDLEYSKNYPCRGIILSNSCDIDPSNARDMPPRVIFAPLIKLSNYIELLRKKGISDGRIGEKVESIRSQSNTSIFFLPSGGPLFFDYMIPLDHVHSTNSKPLLKSGNMKKIFTLNNTGFYIFIFKLSIHFCRLREKLQRHDGPLDRTTAP